MINALISSHVKIHLSQNRKRTKLNFWTWGDFGFVQTLAQILLVKDLP
jgi:hypothetical protein